MMKNLTLLMCCVLVLLISTGCGTKKGAAVKKGKVPAWAKTVPTDDEYIYAVGISGRTMYPTHAIKYATENARRELADMVKTKIVSFVQTIDQGRRENFSMESVFAGMTGARPRGICRAFA